MDEELLERVQKMFVQRGGKISAAQFWDLLKVQVPELYTEDVHEREKLFDVLKIEGERERGVTWLFIPMMENQV